ncbi:MAG: hypothetical protein K2L99_00635, partial [Muribaculaceae bacterium]|nr:hypothetical protein [Muribaculaceae bacterium]
RLESIDRSGNRRCNLSLAGYTEAYEKTLLHTVNVERNQLYNLEIHTRSGIRNLDMSDNRFTTYLFTNFDELRNLDISNNRLSGTISLTYLEQAENIALHNNAIDGLTLVP